MDLQIALIVLALVATAALTAIIAWRNGLRLRQFDFNTAGARSAHGLAIVLAILSWEFLPFAFLAVIFGLLPIAVHGRIEQEREDNPDFRG